MHGEAEALLLGHDELLSVLQVVHVPQFDDAVGGSSGHTVVLIESVVPVLFLELELVGVDILVVGSQHQVVGIVARLEPQSGVFDEVHVPNGARGGQTHDLVARVVVVDRLELAIDAEVGLNACE